MKMISPIQSMISQNGISDVNSVWDRGTADGLAVHSLVFNIRD